jgi:polysaccharide export outer membrane protein
VVLLFLVTVYGCQTIQRDSAPEVKDVYHVQCGDMVSIDVYNEPDLSHKFKVAADGFIHYPLLGRINIEGKSSEDVEKLISKLLGADYLVNPIVSVSVSGSSGRSVMIFGEVRSPGAYEAKSGQRLTLLHVISQAGGFTDIAAKDKVRIVRLVNGKEQKIKVRVSDLLRGRNGITDVNLQPGDVITVPETIF